MGILVQIMRQHHYRINGFVDIYNHTSQYWLDTSIWDVRDIESVYHTDNEFSMTDTTSNTTSNYSMGDRAQKKILHSRAQLSICKDCLACISNEVQADQRNTNWAWIFY